MKRKYNLQIEIESSLMESFIRDSLFCSPDGRFDTDEYVLRTALLRIVNELPKIKSAITEGGNIRVTSFARDGESFAWKAERIV